MRAIRRRRNAARRAQRADRRAGRDLVRAAGRRGAARPQRHQAAAGRRRVPRRSRADDADRSGLRQVRQPRARRRDFFRVGPRASRRPSPASETAALGFTCRSTCTRRCARGCWSKGDSPADAARKPADLKFASPAYFQTIGMTRLSGRPVHRRRRRQTRRRSPSSTCRWRGTTSPTSIRSAGASRSTAAAPGSPSSGIVNDVAPVRAGDEAPTDELYQPFARTGPLSATLLVRTRRAIPRRSRSASRAVVHADRSAPAGQPRSRRWRRFAAARWRRRA